MDNGTLKWFIKQHIIPGVTLTELKTAPSIANANRNPVQMTMESMQPLVWTLNGKQVSRVDEHNDKVTFVFIDGYLDGSIVSGHIQHRDKMEAMPSRLRKFLHRNKVGTKVFDHFLNATNLIRVFEGRLDWRI